jgi:nitrogen fixation/metabolism regulation signal transduction histidine kinase
MVRALANPLLVRALIVLICATAAFLLGLLIIRALRKKITEEADLSPSTSAEALPMHLYNNVIQQLKQQKHELHVQSKSDQHRARISETLSQAVISNLSTGVLVFGATGLVKTANPGAKEILGFASLTGMNGENIFRDAAPASSTRAQASPDSAPDVPARLVGELEAVLHEGSGRRHIDTEYQTPGGVQRFLSVTISPVRGEDSSLLGVTCLINDVSELERIRRDKDLYRELSAEKALLLRSSLATISGYARQLATGDPGQIEQLASDIAQEAEQLERSIGGFLCGRPAEISKQEHSTAVAAGKLN